MNYLMNNREVMERYLREAFYMNGIGFNKTAKSKKGHDVLNLYPTRSYNYREGNGIFKMSLTLAGPIEQTTLHMLLGEILTTDQYATWNGTEWYSWWDVDEKKEEK